MNKNSSIKRNKFLYFSILLLVIIAGLSSRKLEFLPEFIHKYAGDTLWALMVFFIISLIFRKKSTLWVASTALIFSLLIELSQLYHAPWIDSIRATKIGGLVLGFGFLLSDLVCYTIGVLIGYLFERFYQLLKKV